MMSPKKLTTAAGWLVFAIAFIVYFLSAEPTGSLWDCGEFILGAYKLQVVHPPGAPLFLIVGRLFTWVADVLSDNPENIAFAVNVMSGMFTAFAATFVAWITMTFTRLAFVSRDEEMDMEQTLLSVFAGIIAGLATAFSTSIWFSAVEGEVYAMSTFFTAMTTWAMVKWYGLPNEPKNDRWIIFALYSAGLSIGVHLLSLLTLPALALLYYYKKSKKTSLRGAVIATALGALIIPIVQKLVIVGVPWIWYKFEFLMVNGLGMPIQVGIIPTILVLFALGYFGLRYAHKQQDGLIQKIVMSLILLVIGFSSIGVVVIRANANPPINMNDPSDVTRLLPYLNREQYGERPLFRGPHFDARPVDIERSDRYGKVGDRYEVIDHKVNYVYADKDKILLPRIGHTDSNRPQLHRMIMGDQNRKPDMAYNLSYLFRYQIGYMYIRYFMWNFVGRQNGDQGFYMQNDRKNGSWLSGISPLDGTRLYNQKKLPDTIKHNKARNKYFFLPLIFGFIGLFWQLKYRRKDWYGLLLLFMFTGLGIIFYSNQPPNEPRERDYVLIGSIFTFCIWMGMAVPAIYGFIKQKLSSIPSRGIAIGSFALVALAPIIMGFQNFDDHSRRGQYASRDYAANFLESCEPNAIIFTYGDNDTYPLWYAQEVEEIRTDVRVVNLSLIAVDWYIEGLRRKVNDSEAIKLTISTAAYRGDARNSVFPFPDATKEFPMDQALKIMGENHPVQAGNSQYATYLPSTKLYIPVNKQRALASGLISQADANKMVTKIPIKLNKEFLTKDEIAILDVITSNMYDRPIYFSVTCRDDRLMGLHDYTELQGMGLRILPVKTPSNRSFFIYGSGRVDVDKVYDRVMNKWRWGNYDKEDLYVNASYGASVQAHQMIMWRTIQELIRQGDMERAIDITDKFFEGFPHMNFPFTARTLVYINFYVQAGALDKAKVPLRTLANELAQYIQFYDSLKPDRRDAVFGNDYPVAVQGVQELLRVSNQLNDAAFATEIEAILGQYTTQDLQN